MDLMNLVMIHFVYPTLPLKLLSVYFESWVHNLRFDLGLEMSIFLVLCIFNYLFCWVVAARGGLQNIIFHFLSSLMASKFHHEGGVFVECWQESWWRGGAQRHMSLTPVWRRGVGEMKERKED